MPAAESQLRRKTARSSSRSRCVAGATLATASWRRGTGNSGATIAIGTTSAKALSGLASSAAFTAGNPQANTESERNTHGIQAHTILAGGSIASGPVAGEGLSAAP